VSTDRITEALVEALRQALTCAGEQRLVRAGKLEGLFPGRTGAGATAAQQALRDGLLEVVRTETKGKTVIEWVRLTPRGVEYLHEHESPVSALQDIRAALRVNQQAVPLWLADMRASMQALDERLAADAQKWLERLDGLARRVDETLRRLDEAIPLVPPDVLRDHPWTLDALNYLDRRGNLGAGRCPLPELFTALTRQHPHLTVTVFHEGLRRLQERRAVTLHQADDLGSLSQPEYALLDGSRVLYYASR
jgi:hypothetical protein